MYYNVHIVYKYFVYNCVYYNKEVYKLLKTSFNQSNDIIRPSKSCFASSTTRELGFSSII